MINSKNYKKSDLSWGWVIAFLIIFCPVGLFLLYLKLSATKNPSVHSILGWILIALAVSYIILGIYTYQTEDSLSRNVTMGVLIFVFLLCMVGGLISIFKAGKLKIVSQEYDTYVFSEPSSTIFDEAVIQPAAKVIACKNCGATNTIQPGAIQECEFCGSSLR